MTDPITLSLITGAFLLAGFVKGVIGAGLPLISLAILTATVGLLPAIAIMLVPAIVTNIWQASTGGHLKVILRRLWLYLTVAVCTVWLGGLAWKRVDVAWLTALLGVLLVAYAIFNIAGWQLVIPKSRETPIGIAFGVVNGVVAGMTGSCVMPGLIYIQALGFSKDELIQAMGILFTTLTTAVALSMHTNRLLTTELVLLSIGALIPAAIGMRIGQLFRASLSEERFRQIFFVSLMIMGIAIVARAWS